MVAPTALTARCLARSGVLQTAEFLERWWRRRDVALTPVDVWEVAEAGDEVAAGIAGRVAGSLTAAAAAAARRLALAGADCAPYRLVLSGRVLSPGHPVLHERLLTALAAALPAARPRRLSVAPAAGAVLEAADVLGLADQAFSARLLVDAPAAHDP